MAQGGDLDAFVDLVDAGIDRANFEHLRTDFGDEAPVRGAAGGRQLGVACRFRRESPAVRRRSRHHGRSGRAGRRASRRCRSPGHAGRAARTDGPAACSGVLAVPKRKLKSTSTLPGMTLRRRCRRGCSRPARWSAGKTRCLHPRRDVAASSAIAGAARWIGFLRQMRVGDVALDALDGQLRRERAAAAILDHVAEATTSPSVRR
jgi:hypothetical protein